MWRVHFHSLIYDHQFILESHCTRNGPRCIGANRNRANTRQSMHVHMFLKMLHIIWY